MKRAKISGMSVKEYREWMLKHLDGVFIKNESESLDQMVENSPESILVLSAVNAEEFKEVT